MAKTRDTKAAPVATASTAPQYVAPTDVSSRTPAVSYPGGSAPFYLYAIPNRYYLCDARVVPLLAQLGRTPGVNGVAAQRQHIAGGGWRYVPDMSRAIAKLERQGCSIVPFDVDSPDGFPSYLQGIPGTDKVCHRLCSLVPGLEPLPPDPSVWADWLCSLMERGVVPKPHPSQVDAVIEKKRKMAGSQARAGNADRAARLTAQVDRARALLAPKPKPKPKRKPKPKPAPKAIEVVDVLEADPDG